MIASGFFRIVGEVAMVIVLLSAAGCSNLPGKPGTQGAVIGGVGGAAAGAVVGGEKHRVLGAVLGGALGAAGGYVIGANKDRILNRDKSGAEQATQTAQAKPASPQDVSGTTTADLNSDGFVTLDEVVAMEQAGLSDQQMLDRLRATGQIFELTPEQQQYLRSQGVSQSIVSQMQDINRDQRDQLLQQQQGGVISQPPPR